MKLTLKLLTPALFAILFVSCSNDVITPGQDVYSSFEYSVQNTTLDSLNGLSAADDQTLYFTGHGKAWKMENGAFTQIIFPDPNFRIFGGVQALSKNYVLFSGLNTQSFKMQYIIYDNGVMKSYTPAGNTSVGSAYLYAKGKFISGGSTSRKYRIFKDSVFTEYTLPDSAQMSWFATLNNEPYMFAINTLTFDDYYLYKINDSGPLKLRQESAEGIFYEMNNTLIKVISSGSSHSFSYFSPEGWNPLFTYESYERPEYVYYIGGPSKDFFLSLALYSVNEEQFYSAKVWNGTGLYTQNNFPVNDFPANSHVPTFVSEYRNNTFYLYRNNEVTGGKLLKIKLKAQ